MSPEIAVLVPAYDESATIALVIEQFHGELPNAQIWVINSNSKDDTLALVPALLGLTLGAIPVVAFMQTRFITSRREAP